MQKFVKKEDCFTTYEQLPWRKWKPETTRVTARPSSTLFSFQRHPLKIILGRSCSKIFSKIPGKHLRWISVLTAEHRHSYLQKLNCAAWCPWNFEGFISRNIFNWLLYLTCFINYHFPNSYRIITLRSAFVSTQHILRNICW